MNKLTDLEINAKIEEIQCSDSNELGRCIYPKDHFGDHAFPDGTSHDRSDEIRIKVLRDQLQAERQKNAEHPPSVECKEYNEYLTILGLKEAENRTLKAELYDQKAATRLIMEGQQIAYDARVLALRSMEAILGTLDHSAAIDDESELLEHVSKKVFAAVGENKTLREALEPFIAAGQALNKRLEAYRYSATEDSDGVKIQFRWLEFEHRITVGDLKRCAALAKDGDK